MSRQTNAENWRRHSGPYEVSDLGRVRHARTGRVLKPRVKHTRNGYLEVVLIVDGQRLTRTVHRLVLEAFVGARPEGQQCRHLDGNPANNRRDNLAWGTPAENYRDRDRHGTTARGTRLPFSKLTPELVRQIRRTEGRHTDVAERFGVSVGTISHVKNGHCWAWVT